MYDVLQIFCSVVSLEGERSIVIMISLWWFRIDMVGTKNLLSPHIDVILRNTC